MATDADRITEDLLHRAAEGDREAAGRLLELHRQPLLRFAEVWLDRRLAPGLGPSDVVSEAMLRAVRRLQEYLAKRPLPFFVWLRQLARDRMVEEYRRRGPAGREVSLNGALPGESALRLGDMLAASGSGPASALVNKERRIQASELVTRTLGQLGERDREILSLRHLEELSFHAVGLLLNMTEDAARQRHHRAFAEFANLLRQVESEDRP